MLKKLFILSLMVLAFTACRRVTTAYLEARNPVDTVGFAHLDWQMDSLIARIQRSELDSIGNHCPGNSPLKLAICPHDDYSLAAPLYYSLLKDVKANTLFLFGVAHKAKAMGIENKLVFGNYKAWKSPYGVVKIDKNLQDELVSLLDSSLYMISDTLQKVEHSLEALVPFLQHFDPRVEIIPILVPAMSFARMDNIATALAKAMNKLLTRRNLNWGNDFALVVSTDAVHYGDEDWGGKNYAPFGADTLGYWLAVEHEKEIIKNCLVGEINPDKCKMFVEYTVQSDNFREYKWTWCGRYSVPFGMLTAYELGKLQNLNLNGCEYGYATGLDHPHIPVSDLRMGLTNPVKLRHWVGYAAIGYK